MAIELKRLSPFARGFLVTNRLIDYVKRCCRSHAAQHNTNDMVTFYCALERQLVIQIWCKAARKYSELFTYSVDGKQAALTALHSELSVYHDVIGFESLNDDFYEAAHTDKRS